MMTGRQATGRWPSGDMSRVKPVPFLPGVRSPPLQGDNARQDGLMGESPEMAPKAVFSEGRTPCVRVVGLDASRGTA